MGMTKKQLKAYEKGKEIYHAVSIIKNKHLVSQISLFQQGLRTVGMKEQSDKWVKDIQKLKSGVEMSGNKINKALKEGILEYCDLAIDYHESLK